jgi:hypothetical protein
VIWASLTLAAVLARDNDGIRPGLAAFYTHYRPAHPTHRAAR